MWGINGVNLLVQQLLDLTGLKFGDQVNTSSSLLCSLNYLAVLQGTIFCFKKTRVLTYRYLGRQQCSIHSYIRTYIFPAKLYSTPHNLRTLAFLPKWILMPFIPRQDTSTRIHTQILYIHNVGENVIYHVFHFTSINVSWPWPHRRFTAVPSLGPFW